MKILAIRGSNLASLAGEFEIDLSRGPLAEAGVFAIIGNTGAGKSTLLDALCVALFDRTPRLTNHSRVVVGRRDDDPATLGAHDVRTLLRRGATGGYAEVDFESGDARRYRARWAVRRARDRADGTLQDQTLSLIALDSAERLGGTKTETLKAISSRLGLSFDQFRRSALLAQGEFAAFLRADGKDRSELLERMTGTEIYSRLSIAAHLRATLAEQHLRDIRAAALAIAVLDDDARAVAVSASALAHDARRLARQRLDAAEAAARWLAEAGARTSALHGAETDHAGAIDAHAAARPERAELALRQRAARIQTAVEDVLRLETELATCRRTAGELDRSGRSLAEVRTRVAASLTELAAVAAPLQRASLLAGAGRSDLGGELAQPTSNTSFPPQRGHTEADIAVERMPADAARAAAQIRRTEVGIAAESVAAPADAAGAALAQIRRTDGIAAESAAAEIAAVPAGTDLATDALTIGRAALSDAGWIIARAELASEVAGWGALDDRFAEHATIAGVLVTIDRGLAGHERDRAALESARALVATDLRGAQTRLTDEQRTLQTFHERRGPSLDTARKAEDEARVAVADAERLRTIVDGARTATILVATIEREREDLEAGRAIDARRAGELVTEAERAALLRDERTRVLDELRRAAGYAHARTELVEDEPCPLCGALEHPWRERGALDEAIAGARARLDETIAASTRIAAELAAIEVRQTARDRDQRVLAARQPTAIGALETARTQWRALLSATGQLLLDDDPASPAADQLAIDRVTSARKQLEAARDARHQTEAVAKAAEDARARVELARADVDQLAAHGVDLERSVAEIESAAERLRGERRSRAERLDELSTSLREIARRWRRVDRAGDVEQPGSIGDRAIEERAAGSSPTRDVTDLESCRAVDPRTAGSRPTRDATSSDLETCRAVDPRTAGSSPTRDATSSDLETCRAVEAGSGPTWDTSDLETCREALARLETEWRLRGGRVARAAAFASRAQQQIDRESRELERAATEQETRLAETIRRQSELGEQLATATARFETLRREVGLDDAQLLGVDNARPVCLDDNELGPTARAETGRDASGEDQLPPSATIGAAVRDQARTVRLTGIENGDGRGIARKSPIAAIAALVRDQPRTVQLTERLTAIDAAVARAHTIVTERRQLVADHERSRPDAAALADGAEAARVAAELATAEVEAARAAAVIAADDDARIRRDHAFALLAADEQRVEIDRVLGGVIGSHDGKLFRSFAQSLTLDGLLAVANSHLDGLAPRYQLERIPRHDLEIQVIDRDLGDEVRSVQSLSGGEAFLVSLALALGLSSMSAHDVRVRTLLIDEGFGTLDPATLDCALATLDALQATGRQIGVISHVPALVERVGAHVSVIQRGGGRSDVVVRA